MQEIHILATIDVSQNDRAALLALMQEVVTESRKEAGCLRYDLVENLENPLNFSVIETWQSRAAVDAHNASAHFARLVAFLKTHEATAQVLLYRQVM